MGGGRKVEPQILDKDVFGDGSVVMLRTPGHTPGHSSLLVKLKEKGPVILMGGPDTAASILGRDRVMVGVVGGFGASMRGPGHAHHNGMELVRLGELEGPVTPRLRAIEIRSKDI